MISAFKLIRDPMFYFLPTVILFDLICFFVFCCCFFFVFVFLMFLLRSTPTLLPNLICFCFLYFLLRSTPALLPSCSFCFSCLFLFVSTSVVHFQTCCWVTALAKASFLCGIARARRLFLEERKEEGFEKEELALLWHCALKGR